MSKVQLVITKVGTFAIAIAIFSVLFSSPAHAYVDPGSGSVIVTTILGLLAAIGYTFRKFFYNVKAKFFKKKDDSDDRSLDS